MGTTSSSLWEGKKVLFVHYRVGRTDGVSLEISNWKIVMEKRGATVKLCSGVVNTGADFIIEGMEHELDTESEWIGKQAFEATLTPSQVMELVRRFESHRLLIEFGLDRVFANYQPDVVIVSNMLSVGENLPAAVALVNCIDRYQTSTIAVHHDFYWENCRYKEPSCEFIDQVRKHYLPPLRPYLRHSCINRIAKHELLARKEVESSIIYDNIDFHQSLWERQSRVANLLQERGVGANDLVLLQATRVVRRKNIEIAIDFAKQLSQPGSLETLSAKPLFDGRQFDPSNGKVVLLLAGYAEKRDESYLQTLYQHAKDSGVALVHVADLVLSGQLTLEDIYPFADFVTYPSEYEGFGNQFLEAVFACKPVVLFEYPVYLIDIKPLGFKAVSLGKVVNESPSGLKTIPSKTMANAVTESLSILTSPELYLDMVRHNFNLAKDHFSTEVVLKQFEDHLANFQQTSPVV